MRIHAYIVREGRDVHLNLEDEFTPFEILRKLNISPDAVIVMKEGTPIPLNEKLSEDDELKILNVVSGG